MMRQNHLDYRPVDNEQPLDTVSQIVWDQGNSSEPRFLTASWDGFVRLYKITSSGQHFGGKVEKVREAYLHHPVLCLDYDHNGIAFAGLASGEIVAVQCVNQQATVTLGSHAAPICGLFWVQNIGMVMSLGFDDVIRFWKPDCNPPLQGEFKLSCKTAACSYSYPYLLLGSIETTVAFINITKLPKLIIPTAAQYKKVELERFSKFNCCRVQAQCKAAVLGSVDGRVAIMNFNEASNGEFAVMNIIVSKTQKRRLNAKDVFGQVNAVDIGISNMDFFVAIGGSDEMGLYNYYTKSKPKSIVSSPQVGPPTPTTAVSFSPNHDLVAYATGYDWLRGLYDLEQVKRPKILVARLTNSEIASLTTR